MWDEIRRQHPNFNGDWTKLGTWMGNYIQLLNVIIIIHTWFSLSTGFYNILVKESLEWKTEFVYCSSHALSDPI